VDDSSIQKDGWVILDDVFQAGLVRLDAQHHLQVVSEVLFVDLV